MITVIQNGRLIDPKASRDEVVDVWLQDDKVTEITPPKSKAPKDATVIDATDQWVLPGLIDLFTHTREPGHEYKEDLASVGQAAVQGGFCTVLAMPNTQPVVDGAELVGHIRTQAAAKSACRVEVAGALTVGTAGERMAPLGEMVRAGARALTDGPYPIADAALFRSVLDYGKHTGALLMSRPENSQLARMGMVHEGAVATRLGLPGIPVCSETIAMLRDIEIARDTGAPLHVGPVSSRAGVALVARAKADGLPITASVSAHHLILTVEDVRDYDPATKLRPPLRTKDDRDALWEGLESGALDAIVTSHAPQGAVEKTVAFADAAFGALGLQTTLPLLSEEAGKRSVEALTLMRALAANPAQLLKLEDRGTLASGAMADIVVFDPRSSWRWENSEVVSRSLNCPYLGRTLVGRVQSTLIGGKMSYTARQKRVSSVD